MPFQVFKTCRISMEGAYGDAGFISWMYALKVIIWVGVSSALMPLVITTTMMTTATKTTTQ